MSSLLIVFFFSLFHRKLTRYRDAARPAQRRLITISQSLIASWTRQWGALKKIRKARGAREQTVLPGINHIFNNWLNFDVSTCFWLSLRKKAWIKLQRGESIGRQILIYDVFFFSRKSLWFFGNVVLRVPWQGNCKIVSPSIKNIQWLAFRDATLIYFDQSKQLVSNMVHMLFSKLVSINGFSRWCSINNDCHGDVITKCKN